MMFPTEGRPADQRGFIHKSKFGKFVGGAISTATSFIPAVGIAKQAVGFGQSLFGKQKARPVAPRTTTARPSLAGAQGKELGRQLKLGDLGGVFQPQRSRGIIAPRGSGLPPLLPVGGGGGRDPGGRAGPCDFPMVLDSAGRCRTPTSGEFGGEQFGVGAAVMGRYGAALEPGSQIIDRAICLRGMQLGDDGLCYNKSQITNKQRMWPAGRKPLLSGGDMRAISIAARAGRRLEGATKRLQRLGMMKKATPRRLAPHQHAKASTAVVSVP